MKTLKRKNSLRQISTDASSNRTQYCKKIKGKIYYFGTDKKQALEKYLDQVTCLHGCRNLIQKTSNGNMTLKGLYDLYLQYQHSKVLANDLYRKTP